MPQIVRYGASATVRWRYQDVIKKDLGFAALQATCADVDDLIRDTGFKPATTLEYGIGKQVVWYWNHT